MSTWGVEKRGYSHYYKHLNKEQELYYLSRYNQIHIDFVMLYQRTYIEAVDLSVRVYGDYYHSFIEYEQQK